MLVSSTDPARRRQGNALVREIDKRICTRPDVSVDLRTNARTYSCHQPTYIHTLGREVSRCTRPESHGRQGVWACLDSSLAPDVGVLCD